MLPHTLTRKKSSTVSRCRALVEVGVPNTLVAEIPK